MPTAMVIATAGSEGEIAIPLDPNAIGARYSFDWTGHAVSVQYRFESLGSWSRSRNPDPQGAPSIPTKQVMLRWQNQSDTDETFTYTIEPVFGS